MRLRPRPTRRGATLVESALVLGVFLLVLFSVTSLLDLGSGARVDFLAPGIIALAVMSTAFTGQAIGTGFERRYGVLKRLGATALPRSSEHLGHGRAARLLDQPGPQILLERLMCLGGAPAQDSVCLIRHILDLHAGHGAIMAPSAPIHKWRGRCR